MVQGTSRALQRDRACDKAADVVIDGARGGTGYQAAAAAPTPTGINLILSSQPAVIVAVEQGIHFMQFVIQLNLVQ